MITKRVGNLIDLIEELKLDGIQSAANGIGPMGRGIAGAIRRAGGYEVQADAFRVCGAQDPQPGQAYITLPGKLGARGIKNIVHAVTMKQPGGPTSLEVVGRAFGSALVLAAANGVKRMGCTALGTGVGGLDSKKVAGVMMQAALKVYRELPDIMDGFDVVFIDLDKTFIENVSECRLTATDCKTCESTKSCDNKWKGKPSSLCV